MDLLWKKYQAIDDKFWRETVKQFFNVVLKKKRMITKMISLYGIGRYEQLWEKTTRM